MSTTTPQPPKFKFTATIPGISPDLASEGIINNLSGKLDRTVNIPRKSGQKKGSIRVEAPSSAIITFLFIKPTNLSATDCRKLYFKPRMSSMPGQDTTQKGPGSGMEPYPPDQGSDQHQHGGGGEQTGPKQYEQKDGPQQQYPTYNLPPPPPPPPKDNPHGICIYTPTDPKQPGKGGNYYYPNDPNDPSQGGTYIPVSQGSQQTSMATQLTSPTKSSTQTASSTEDGRLSLQNDLFLIGNDLITRLLGKDVTGVVLENESDKEVSVQVVIGYDTDDTDDTDDSQYE